MRPDEHKKKTSSRYKSKHGIEASTGKKNTEKDLQSNLKSAQQDKEFKQTDLNREDEGFKKSYSRRAVSSNWERYNEPEDVVEQIGADFNELVSSAAGAASHMVLGSEKHWEDNQELDDVLTIDFQKLADSLSQLPFCERLGLDEAQFDPSLLQLLYDDDARATGSASTLTPITTFTLNKFDFQKPNETVLTKQETREKTHIDKLKEVSEDQHRSIDAQDPVIVEPEASVEPLPCDTREDVVDDGNATLPTTTNTPAIVSSKPTTSKNPSDEIETLELELDSLLDGGSPATDAGLNQATPLEKVQSVTIPATPNKESSEQDELEDWLDSII